eukprot:GHVL01039402.1.p1 GENE.GHVL01039402.1~~GHVL01039402.1.p1  ORF type:complete len:738 (-),score=153.59 GHVL01039402.1:261-2474(-)
MEGLNVMSMGEFAETMRKKHPNDSIQLLEDEFDDSIVERGEKDILFPSHRSETEISKAISEGRAFQGTLRMMRDSFLVGFVNCHSTGGDIRIGGLVNLNRAIDGDVVAIEIIKSDDKEDRFEEDIENELESVKPLRLVDDEKEVITADLLKIKKDKIAGRVIGVIKRNWREYCGSLQDMTNNFVKGMKIDRKFIPIDQRIPLIMIRTKHSEELENKRIVVVIDEWDRFSRYPRGHWTLIMGETGDRNTESNVILHEHGCYTREFSRAVMQCLPPKDFVIPEDEISKRLDLRDEICMSVDPPGCRDIDDALSCKTLSNGNFKIGCHIADVTHFVKAGSDIDREASLRCTTVYLVDRRTDMLPGLLTTDLCSLNEGKDRLTFSVLWEMTKEGEVVNKSFHKAIIRSKRAFSYEEAQMAIDDTSRTDERSIGLRNLLLISKKIRKKRMEGGGVSLASAQPHFDLDSEKYDPVSIDKEISRDTNQMIEEFMVLANCTVAEKILSHFPECSVLRKHPPPKIDSIMELNNLIKDRGYPELLYNTNKELSKSLNNIYNIYDPLLNYYIRILCTKCMNEAKYFSSGSNDGNYEHYGLGVNLYTHFTSPIRRYADIMVHRLLAAALRIESLSTSSISKDQVSKQCDLMSLRHRQASFAGRASLTLYTYLYFKKHGSKTDVDGVVTRVRRNGLQIQLPLYGIEGVVYMEEKEWKLEKNNELVNQNGTIISVFDHILVEIMSSERNYR